MPPADRRIAALRQAARDKHQQAVQRAEAGIRRLTKEGEKINFRAVARAAGVSPDFLYAHTDLRKRIETLRGQQQAENRPPLQAPSGDDGTVIHTLTEALRRERTTHRERVHELERRLAAAHGEILRLHRVIQSHGPRP
ncbi:DUF6262 family protein [Streptomyces sp. NPDC055157]